MFEYFGNFPRGKIPLRNIARHLLGLYHGMPRARVWRRRLSDAALLAKNDPRLLLETLDEVEGGIMEAA
jgi:tRNA-dihydrouridine synthase A